VDVRQDSSSGNGCLSKEKKTKMRKPKNLTTFDCNFFTLMRVSSSSSPRMANCKWRGVIRLTYRKTNKNTMISLSLFLFFFSLFFFSLFFFSLFSHLQVLGGVSGQLQHFGRQVLEDGGSVDGSGGSDTAVGSRAALQHAVNTTDRKLQTGLARARHGCLSLRLKKNCKKKIINMRKRSTACKRRLAVYVIRFVCVSYIKTRKKKKKIRTKFFNDETLRLNQRTQPLLTSTRAHFLFRFFFLFFFFFFFGA
jgi:hypothetical protein